LDKPELMKPDEIYPFEVVLYPTSNLFTRDHRIRVDVSSSNWPRFDVNPNTGDPPDRGRRFATADNAIYNDAEHSSHIILPIVERGDA